MEIKTYFPQDILGKNITSVTATLWLAGTTSVASGIKSETGAALGNPWSVSSGKVSFQAPDGDYDLRLVGGGRTVVIRTRFVDNVTAKEGAEAALAQTLVAKNAAADSADDADAARVAAEAAKTRAEVMRTEAMVAKSLAEAARDVALMGSKLYDDLTVGQSATPVGQYFSVISPDPEGFVDVYKQTGPFTSDLVKSYPSVEAFFDLLNHNAAPDAHADIRQSLVDHNEDPDAHADIRQGLVDHNEDPDAHADIRQSLVDHNDDPDAHGAVFKKTRSILGVLERGDGVPDLALNDGLLTGGFYGMRSTRDELAAIYEEPKYPAASIGFCSIALPTETSVGFVAPSCPNISHNGTSFRAIPVEVSTILPGTSVSAPLFRPTRTNGWGCLVWKYIGSDPITCLLNGTLSILARVSTNKPTAVGDYLFTPLLRLRSWGAPSFELYPTKDIGSAIGVLETPKVLQTTGKYEDYNRPIDASALAAATTVLPWPGSDQGSISSGSTSEALTSSASANVKTSKWIDVSAYTGRALLFDFAGTSTVSRIQIKRANGSIYYSAQSADISAHRIYSISNDAAQIRVYYSSESDAVSLEAVKVLTVSAGGNYNYLSGYWTQYTMSVSSDVTFWPGAEYALNMSGALHNGALAWDFGFRFSGGELSFAFDASAHYTDIARRAYKD